MGVENGSPHSASGRTLLDIRGLRLRRGRKRVLEDVHLALGAGEIYGLIGPNGAGKSTTIAAALGLLPREAGAISVLGLDPARDAKAIHARCGVLPEQGDFYGWMTAPDYLAFFARLYGRDTPVAEIDRRLRDVGLCPRTGQAIAAFSRGMRQRLGLARALICDPELLILDEPTNGLDPRGRREIHDLLIALSQRGTGILMCTHLLDDVERLCDRIGVIQDGRTAAEGRIADLIDAGRIQRRFRLRLTGSVSPSAHTPAYLSIVATDGAWLVVDIDPDVDPSLAWRELLESGWPIAEVHATGGDLEAFYLRLTERRAA